MSFFFSETEEEEGRQSVRENRTREINKRALEKKKKGVRGGRGQRENGRSRSERGGEGQCHLTTRIQKGWESCSGPVALTHPTHAKLSNSQLVPV